MRRLGVLLLPEFSNLGLAAVTEPLFVANWLAQRTLFEWRSVSVDGKPVRASNGALLTVDGDLGGVKDCPSVFVLASFEPLAGARSRPLTRWLQRAARSGVELGGIENGSLALAEAGLLDNHPAAIHWDNLAGFQELFPKVRVAPGAFSFTRNRLTCAGAAAILDMMIAWIARHADPLPCEVIAQRLNISLRQLERRFQQALGRTVHAEYRLVRVERAHQYLQQTHLSVTEVAALTGFSSVEYFSKVYRRAFAVLPSIDRRQATDAPVFRKSPGLTTRKGHSP